MGHVNLLYRIGVQIFQRIMLMKKIFPQAEGIAMSVNQDLI